MKKQKGRGVKPLPSLLSKSIVSKNTIDKSNRLKYNEIESEVTQMINIKFSDTMTADEIDNNIAQLREIYTPETAEEKQIQETFIATLRAALVDKDPQAIATLREFIKYVQSKKEVE